MIVGHDRIVFKLSVKCVYVCPQLASLDTSCPPLPPRPRARCFGDPVLHLRFIRPEEIGHNEEATLQREPSQ